MSSVTHSTLTPRSLKAQLTLWYLLMLGAALAAFAIVVIIARQRTLHREADEALEIRAQYLVGSLQVKLLELDLAGALSADRLIAGAPVAVRERSGRLIYRSPAFPTLGGADDSIAVNAARTDGTLLTVRDLSGEAFRLATIVVKRAGASPVVVQTTASMAPVQRTILELALAMGFWFVLVLAIASYGGAFIADRALRPVDAIVGRVRAIQASRLSDRLDLHTGSEELDRLVDTLNGMLDRLETSMHGARRFAADASHELQTPIAAMRTALDNCLAGGRNLPEPYRAMADDLVVDLDRLSTLIRDLRLLALADAGHLFDQLEDVDLTTVVHECCEIVHGVAEPKQITLTIDVLSDITVRGSVPHLRRAILNLAHNAVRYSPEGSTVQITVGQLDEEAVLVIVDEGCGIPPDDLPHVFERFYRADPARARDTGGTGLGLAIADQIVRSHGGRIEVSSELDRGSTFAVFLPFSAASAPSPDRQALTINAG
jgi:signal transduction histidine kinase